MMVPVPSPPPQHMVTSARRLPERSSSWMLAEYAITATWDGLAPALVARYGGLADRIFGYGPAQAWIDSPDLARRWRAVAEAVHAPS